MNITIVNDRLDLKEAHQDGKPRMVYMDVAKFVAIVLVCIGHVLPVTVGNDSELNRMIYSFHMPLFMMISGFFSVNALSLPTSQFVKRKSIQLLLPALVFSVIQCLYLWILGKGNTSKYIAEMYGGVWFLKSLFACYLILFLSMKLFSNRKTAFLFSIILALALLGTLKINFMLLFFISGYVMKKSCMQYHSRIGIITTISFIIFLVSFFTGLAVPSAKYSLSVIIDSPLLIVKDYFVGLSGSLAMIGICNYLAKIFADKTIISKISHIGEYTLGIYVVQIILLERISADLFSMSGLEAHTGFCSSFLSVVSGVLFAVVCYHIVALTSRNRAINLLCYGNQYKR